MTRIAGITREDIKTFTTGDCYILAETISEQTGWPECAFATDWFPQGSVHAFVKCPDGKYLDIEGRHSRVELEDRWGYCDITENPDFSGWSGFGNWERAKEIAPVLIRFAEDDMFPGQLTLW